MERDWMIQVLNDLRTFAELNGMETLAGKLDEARNLAQLSLTSSEAETRSESGRHGTRPTSFARNLERHH